jgi:hypothetical protein
MEPEFRLWLLIVPRIINSIGLLMYGTEDTVVCSGLYQQMEEPHCLASLLEVEAPSVLPMLSTATTA